MDAAVFFLALGRRVSLRRLSPFSPRFPVDGVVT